MLLFVYYESLWLLCTFFFKKTIILHSLASSSTAVMAKAWVDEDELALWGHFERGPVVNALSRSKVCRTFPMRSWLSDSTRMLQIIRGETFQKQGWSDFPLRPACCRNPLVSRSRHSGIMVLPDVTPDNCFIGMIQFSLWATAAAV